MSRMEDGMEEKYIQYPLRSGDGMEDFVVHLNKSSADGILLVGLISEYGFNGYEAATCSKEKMPYCQAVVVRDSERFGRELPRILESNGLGRIVGESQEAGTRGHTVFEFYPEVLRSINPTVFAAYERSCGFHEKAPISFEKSSVKGVEWQFAMREYGGARYPFAAVALGNPEAPIMVTPENGSYMLVVQGESPQSYETMEQALDQAREHVLALPERERDAYLAHPTGRKGIYQLGGSEYSINAYVSHSSPGMICTEVLETHGLLDKTSWEPDDMRFDGEPSFFSLHEGFLDIEDCVKQVASELLGEEFPQVEFAAPCDHAIETIGEYRELMKGAGVRNASLDDLMKEAKDKAAERNANRNNPSKQEEPDMGL